MKILLVEDEKITRITLSETLRSEGYVVAASPTGLDALEKLEQNRYDIVITDLRLPKVSGLDILKYIKEHTPDTTVIVITAFATVETAVEALKLGAFDYLTKPFSPDKLLSMINHIRQYQSIQNENITLKKRLKLFENSTVVGNSDVIKKLMKTIQAVAKNDYTILIEGESGTGKEVLARAIHHYSHRADAPLIAVNCAAIPESLLESELFGHEKGAFTGAEKRHAGYFERAQGGTLFIDDIDDFPLWLQVKLLRVLQEKELVRVGGSETLKVDVRVVCATKINLLNLVHAGKFREDLYYRLNIIPLHLPPLRERKEDIPALVEYFFTKHNAKDKLNLLTARIMEKLFDYDWPGNVRELENFTERMIALSEIGDWESVLFEFFDRPGRQRVQPPPESESHVEYTSYDDFIYQKEKELFDWALKKSGNNITKAADLLGLPRSTFRSKMEKNKYFNQ